MTISISPIDNAVAAEVAGLDCSHPLSEENFRTVKQAFLDHPVLIFRRQNVSAAALADFGRRFGPLEIYAKAPAAPASANQAQAPQAALRQTDPRETPDQMLYLHPDQPDVLLMSNEVRADLAAIGIVDNAETWHADGSHRRDPYQAIILHAVKNPEAGGDTEFCDMRSVYDALAPDMKAKLQGSTASHHWSKSRNPRFTGKLSTEAWAAGERIANSIPAMKQPVVRTHPETGRPSLFISPRFTLQVDGMDQDASEALLSEIFAFAEKPRFIYRHQWRENDLVIWDNRCLSHRVRAFSTTDLRSRHRVTVSGDQPFYNPYFAKDDAKKDCRHC